MLQQISKKILIYFFLLLILGTINNGLTLMNVSSSWQEVAKGTVLILAVGLDQWRMRA